jgi:hypothetical protein
MHETKVIVRDNEVEVTDQNGTRRYILAPQAADDQAGIITTLKPQTGTSYADYLFAVNGPEGSAAIVLENGVLDVTLTRITQTGNSMALLMKGCDGVVVDGLTCINGLVQDKVVYTGGPGVNKNITLKNLKVWCPPPIDSTPEAKKAAAEHALRFHGWQDVVILDSDISYANFAYKGAALTVHEHGEGMNIVNTLFRGPVGFGNLPVNYNARPGWEAYRVKNVTVDSCVIETPNWFHAEPGVENLSVYNTRIRAIRWPTVYGGGYTDLTPYGQVLNLKPPRDPWPCNGSFQECHFEGTTLMNAASKATVEAGHWSFAGCTFNGQPIDPKGNVI